MNTDDFIKSGVLKDYCLGLLTLKMMTEVEQFCREHPAAAAELLRLQQGLENYVVNNTNWKNEKLKNKIWNEIAGTNPNKDQPG